MLVGASSGGIDAFHDDLGRAAAKRVTAMESVVAREVGLNATV